MQNFEPNLPLVFNQNTAYILAVFWNMFMVQLIQKYVVSEKFLLGTTILYLNTVLYNTYNIFVLEKVRYFPSKWLDLINYTVWWLCIKIRCKHVVLLQITLA